MLFQTDHEFEIKVHENKIEMNENNPEQKEETAIDDDYLENAH